MLLVSGIERLKTKPGFFRWLDIFVIIAVFSDIILIARCPSQPRSTQKQGRHILRGALRHPQYFTIRVCFFNPCFRVPVLECFLPGSSTSARTYCTSHKSRIHPEAGFPNCPLCSSCPLVGLAAPGSRPTLTKRCRDGAIRYHSVSPWVHVFSISRRKSVKSREWPHVIPV